MSQKAIALFDSGIGGLTVLKAIKKILPDENYIFLGDTARLPYGTKSEATIIRYACQAASLLAKYDIKLLVIACNTVSAVAIPSLVAMFPQLSILGVLEPGAENACQKTKNKNIVVMATESTTKSGAYPRAIRKILPDAKIESLACPLFVPLAEDGFMDGPIVEGIIAHYTKNLFPKGNKIEKADTLVLGCTHYPLLSKAIQKVVGENINLVDSASTTAFKVKNILTENELLNTNNPNPTLRFLTTDDCERSAALGSKFLDMYIANQDIELVDL